MDEEWKCLVYHNKTFNDFEVSNTGKLRNVRTGTEYKTYKNKQGYYQVCVSLGSCNNKQVFKIHRAVAETFISNQENKPQVNHIDGDKTNNCVDNLEWATNLENSHHAWKNGLITSHESKSRKLSDEQVEYIRENYIANDKIFGCRPLANKFGVHHKTISDIIEYKTYK